jgi:hypothetical protein
LTFKLVFKYSSDSCALVDVTSQTSTVFIINSASYSNSIAWRLHDFESAYDSEIDTGLTFYSDDSGEDKYGEASQIMPTSLLTGPQEFCQENNQGTCEA